FVWRGPTWPRPPPPRRRLACGRRAPPRIWTLLGILRLFQQREALAAEPLLHMTEAGGLLIAIPTYNERENIGALLPTLLALHPDAHVVVVDDNSPDGTGDIVAGLAGGDRRIHPHPPGPERGAGPGAPPP